MDCSKDGDIVTVAYYVPALECPCLSSSWG